MKSMALTGIRRMEMREVPAPTIEGARDVLIRMACVGVCGSDVHYYSTGRIGSQVVEYPFTVGHEGAGTVVEVGVEVKRVKPGDRIAIEPAMSCWQCDQCLAGRPHTCRQLRFLGCPGQAEGCLSEFIAMPEECCFPLAAGQSFHRGALSEPLAIGIYAVRQSVPMHGATIAILGVGPIGLSVLVAARAAGCSQALVTDKIDERLAVACARGAAAAANPLKEDVVASSQGLDAVFECCGQQEALDQAIALLKPGGKLMLVGIPEVDRVSFAIDAMRRKEICVQNVRRQVHCVQPALDGIADGSLPVDFMVTHRFAFDRTKEAFDLVADYRDGVVKAMIEFQPITV